MALAPFSPGTNTIRNADGTYTVIPGVPNTPDNSSMYNVISDSRGSYLQSKPTLPTMTSDQSNSFWGSSSIGDEWNAFKNSPDYASQLADAQAFLNSHPSASTPPQANPAPAASGGGGGGGGGAIPSPAMPQRTFMPPAVRGFGQLPNRAYLGPGTFPAAYRPIPQVSMTQMPGRGMPAFPGQLTSPYVSPDASGISPQQRGQQSGLSPAMMQYLQSLMATFGGQVPMGMFGPPPRLRATLPAGPGTTPPTLSNDPSSGYNGIPV